MGRVFFSCWGGGSHSGFDAFVVWQRARDRDSMGGMKLARRQALGLHPLGVLSPLSKDESPFYGDNGRPSSLIITGRGKTSWVPISADDYWVTLNEFGMLLQIAPASCPVILTFLVTSLGVMAFHRTRRQIWSALVTGESFDTGHLKPVFDTFGYGPRSWVNR